eukprot:CAMPEP_0178450178 /NCGR_PEP_ID=MMETSP0689_2-20121128/42971_1 /TAXON_ID=160604 /ORGANISM="Amphidinium massartii, Strain CS-259" /LENGTH=524 /DNA_ID=CAMNT_0020075597 /DNA_START=74 /DNA_END=1648 /DNA_ORIENTATION=+
MLGDPGAFNGKWIDAFMGQIAGREYDNARETLRRAVAGGVSDNIARQYASVLEDFLRKVDEVENMNSTELHYGRCAIRNNTDGTGRGLFVPGFCSWGEELWKERPLVYIQSPASRKAAKVCCACLTPIGTLATQLLHMGLPVPPGAEEVSLSSTASGSTPVAAPCSEDELGKQSTKPTAFDCPGCCGESFCSEECCRWALEFSSHALLCGGRLPSDRLGALRAIEALADEADQEHLLLLAHHVATMLLHRKRGMSLELVLQRYARQFVSKSWESLAAESAPSGSGNVRQDGSDPSQDTPEVRRKLLARTTGLLHALFAGEELAEKPLLDPDLLGSIIGSFELVNMCISLPHPLNKEEFRPRLKQLLDLPTAQKLLMMQKKAEEEEGDASDEEEAAGDEPAEEETVESLEECSLFANVVGSALCEALALTNHSCLPNCEVDFATPGTAYCGDGPGLWMYCMAKRPLIPGDEVLMTYLPSVVGQPLEIRRRRLEKFGFTCQCRCCLTDESLAREGVAIPPMPTAAS